MTGLPSIYGCIIFHCTTKHIFLISLAIDGHLDFISKLEKQNKFVSTVRIIETVETF